MEAKRELKVNYNSEILPFCSEPKYLGVTLDRSITYRRHLESLRKKLTSRVALLRRLAGSGWGAGATTLSTATLSLVHSTAEHCAPVWCRSDHTRLIDTTINDALRIVTGCLRPTPADNLPIPAGIQHAELRRRGATISRTPCHGAWTPAPLSAHPSIGCRWKAPQIEIPICTRRSLVFMTTTYCTCGAVGGQPHKTLHFNSRHRYTHTRNDPPKKSLGPAQPLLHRCRTCPLLPVQMGYGLLCGLWVWRRTNRRPCRPPLSNPSTPPRTTRPDGSGRWHNRMAAQHLPWHLGG